MAWRGLEAHSLLIRDGRRDLRPGSTLHGGSDLLLGLRFNIYIIRFYEFNVFFLSDFALTFIENL